MCSEKTNLPSWLQSDPKLCLPSLYAVIEDNQGKQFHSWPQEYNFNLENSHSPACSMSKKQKKVKAGKTIRYQSSCRKCYETCKVLFKSYLGFIQTYVGSELHLGYSQKELDMQGGRDKKDLTQD